VFAGFVDPRHRLKLGIRFPERPIIPSEIVFYIVRICIRMIESACKRCEFGETDKFSGKSLKMTSNDDDDSLGTRGQNAYRLILAAIREGSYKPGDRLREEEVAARFGMSRTPVREGLGRLQEKGLVEAASGRGLAVATLNMQQVLELYAMREEAEGMAARFASQQITAVEIENMERLNEEFLAASGDPVTAARVNRLFHARLYDAARNRYLRQALDDLQDTIALLAETTFVEPGRTEVAYKEHLTLIDSLRRRAADDAYRTASDHIRAALRARLRMSN